MISVKLSEIMSQCYAGEHENVCNAIRRVISRYCSPSEFNGLNWGITE